MPTQKGLDGVNRAVLERDHRLIGEMKLVTLERAAKVILNRQPLECARTHRAAEHLESSATALLGLIERRVGIA